MRRVILPQAMIVAIPNLGKQFYQSGKGDVAGIRYRSHGYDGKSEGSRRKQHALLKRISVWRCFTG